MQQLPEEFNTNSQSHDVDDYEEVNNFEPINAGQRDSAARYSNKGAMPTGLVIALAVLLSVLINACVIIVTSDKPFKNIAATFGLAGKSPDQDTQQQIAIEQSNEIVGRHTGQIEQITASIKALGEYLSDVKTSIAETDTKIARLENRVEEAVNEINKFKVQRVTPKPVVAVKPKEPPKPQIFVSLVSIRSQGGGSWVTLREGLDTSPLMAAGDEWHSVKLIAADVNNKSAQIAINGTVSVVKL